MVDQAPTCRVSVESVMRRANFRLGVEDVRAGRRPRFDDLHDYCWAYERGRLFGRIAPLDMPVFVNGELNRKAMALFDAACRRGFIT
jgi:hypothetical protein